MSRLQATEIKAFVPAQDFAMSTSFYTDLGFTQRSEGGGVACLSVDGCAILLQDFPDAGLADKLMMHLLVHDVAAWRAHVDQANLVGRHGACITPVVEQPWGITDFTLTDPSGLCWRIGQNTPGFTPVGRLPDTVS